MRIIAGLLLPIITPATGLLIDRHLYSFVDSAFAVFMLLMAFGIVVGLVVRRRWVVAYAGLIAMGWWLLRPVFFDLSGPSRTDGTVQLMMWLVLVCAPVVVGTAVGVQLAALDEDPESDIPPA